MSRTKQELAFEAAIAPELTKGQIREEALKYFRAQGVTCWRQNNTSPTRRRTFIGQYGLPDIIGYTGNGTFFACEIKTKGDKLSLEQSQFLVDLNKSGGWGYVAEDNGNGAVFYRLYLVNDVPISRKRKKR